MKFLNALGAATIFAATFLVAGFSPAQDAVATATAAADEAKSASWESRCSGVTRDVVLDCAMEMRAVMSNSGQLLTGVTIRVPGETRSPVIMVHVPIGIFLPAALQLSVDDAPVAKFDLQTCDNSGCYAGGPVSNELLAALKAGQNLSVVFQDLQQTPIAVTVPLTGFTKTFVSIL